MDESDLFPASIRSGTNFSVYPQYSRIEDHVASLKDICTASTKRLLTQYLLHKYKSKAWNSSARYQNSSDVNFFRAGRLYFNPDVFSCAMALLIIFVSKTKVNFIYVNITMFP